MFTIEQLSVLGINTEDIKSGVIEAIKEEVMPTIKKDVVESVRKELRAVVAEQTSAWVADALSRPIQPVNHWGEAEGKPASIKEIISQKAAAFMTEKVDVNGKVSDSYRNDTPRYLWAAQKVAEDAMNKELRPQLDKVIAEMKNEIQAGISKVVADLVARNFSR